MTSTTCHSQGVNDLIFHPSGKELISCGTDGHVFRTPFEFDVLDKPSKAAIDIEALTNNPLTSLAVSPQGQQIAIGTADHCVHLINHDDFKYEALPTRLQSPVRHVQFTSVGSRLICAGDDPTVKVVSLITNTVTPLEGHPGPVRCVESDPKGELVATASEDQLKIWNLKEGKLLKTITQQFYKTVISDDVQLRMSWHPKGRYLALPGQANVILLNPEGWNISTALKHHNQDVTIVSWSKNGKYLATTGLDKKLFIWQLSSKQVVDMVRLDDVCMAISWSSKEAKSVAYSLKNGTVWVWSDWNESPEGYSQTQVEEIEGSTSEPTKATDDKDKSKQTTSRSEDSGSESEDDFRIGKKNRFTPKKEHPKKEAKAPVSNSDADSKDKTHESGKTPRKLKKWKGKKSKSKKKDNRTVGDGSMVDEDEPNIPEPAPSPSHSPSRDILDQLNFDDDPEFGAGPPTGGILSKTEEEIKALEQEEVEMELVDRMNVYEGGMSASTQMQEAFQSGSTQAVKGKKFLAWNMFGAITRRHDEMEETGYDVIEVEFSDRLKHKQVRINDNLNYSLAALAENGAIFASKIEEPDETVDPIPARLYYHPFSSWAANSQWEYKLPSNEDVVSVAASLSFAAVATTKQYVRIFTPAGIQRSIFCIPGPVVTIHGNDNTLAVVYHAGAPWAGNQNLSLRLIDLESKTTVYQGAVPLSRGAILKWVTFTDHNVLMCLDDYGVLRALMRNCGYEWTPVLDFATVEKVTERDMAWPVGLFTNTVMCAIIKKDDLYPRVSPRPMLTPIPLQIPLLEPDSEDAKMEEELLRAEVMLREARVWAKTRLRSEQETFGEQLKKHTARHDRTVIKYFTDYAETNAAKALDIAMLTSTNKATKGCAKYANAENQAVLAFKIGAMLAKRTERSTSNSTYATPQTNRREQRSQRTPRSAYKDSLPSTPSRSRHSTPVTQTSATRDFLSPRKNSKQQAKPQADSLASPNGSKGKRKINPFAKNENDVNESNKKAKKLLF